MCIAIYKPAGKNISEEVLKECFDSNKDGCGFAYINTDIFGIKRLKIYKSMKFEPFYHQYRRAVRFNPESPFIIHFRIATHGTVDKFNCHPFFINRDTVFIHNGIISGVTKDDKKSDTQMFNEEFLQHIDTELLVQEGPVKKLIEKFVIGSKLVILNVEGDVQIYNESSGNWNDGVWYSNYSWKPRTSAVTTYHGSARRQLTELSYQKCDDCGTYHTINTMRCYRKGISIELFCKDCSKKVPEKYKMNEVSILQFIDYNNELVMFQ